MTQQQFAQFDEQIHEGYPVHMDRRTETSGAAIRRFLYCATLVLLIIFIATAFEPALAVTFYAFAAIGLAFSLWRLVTSSPRITAESVRTDP